MKTTEKDILWITKNHYDKEKHANLRDALDAYYRKEYEVDTDTIPSPMPYDLIYTLWLIPCIREFLTAENKNQFICYLEKESLYERQYAGQKRHYRGSFYKTMFYRVTDWMKALRIRDHNGNWIIDLSDYQGDII